MNQEIEKCLKAAQEAKDAYITAYKRWYEKNQAYELIVVAMIADGSDAKTAWYKANGLTAGRDALELLRSSEIEKETARYNLEIALSILRATIDLK